MFSFKSLHIGDLESICTLKKKVKLQLLVVVSHQAQFKFKVFQPSVWQWLSPLKHCYRCFSWFNVKKSNHTTFVHLGIHYVYIFSCYKSIKRYNFSFLKTEWKAMLILYDSTSPEIMCNGKNTKSNINCSAQFLKSPFPWENAKLQLSLINGRGHFLALDNIFRRLITLFSPQEVKIQ